MGTTIVERLTKVAPLKSGAHKPPTGDDINGCAMEIAAFVAGEPWSDHPECVCPVLGAFMRAWNDGLPDDATRDELLRPLIPRLIGTRGSKTLEQRRATMAADWLIRTHTVAWLRLAKLDAAADGLAMLPEITDFARCPALMPALRAAQSDAAAAWDAAWEAARDAAWDAARHAARDAARAAARAAARGAAAWDAAWAAARAAARDAARDAAWDALKPTQLALQQSALALVNRMIEATEQ